MELREEMMCKVEAENAEYASMYALALVADALCRIADTLDGIAATLDDINDNLAET